MDLAELKNRFEYHPPVGEVTPRMHQSVREWCLDMATHFDVLLPEGREKSTVFSKIEEVMFWANAAIARNQ